MKHGNAETWRITTDPHSTPIGHYAPQAHLFVDFELTRLSSPFVRNQRLGGLETHGTGRRVLYRDRRYGIREDRNDEPTGRRTGKN